MPTITFIRKVSRYFPAATVRKQIDLVIKKYRVRYTLERSPLGWVMIAEMATKYENVVKEVLANRFSPPWVVQEGLVIVPEDPTDTPIEPEKVHNVNRDFAPDAFSRLFGVDAHIRRVFDAINLGADTNWLKRKHTLLAGPPGCGKTEIMRTFAANLGRENEAWVWYDATSTTRAGAIEQIMKAASVPPILFVEEIEKAPESSLRWLLGVMDDRGEVRRTNYRVGNQQKSVRQLVISTANSIPLLEKMDSGALFSRFSNRIGCDKPSPESARQIFLREVRDIQGDERWVDQVLPYYMEPDNTHGVRECLSLLLCGRDRLLDGSFHDDYKATQLKGTGIIY